MPLMTQLSLLSVDEKIHLSHLEQKIEAGRRAIWEMAQALVEVRDKRLYRENYSTFEAYCEERWDISRPFAYNLIAASRVYANVCHGIHQPENERQLRPLMALPPEQQVEAWETAVELADGVPTSGQTKRVAEVVKKGNHPSIQAGQTVEVMVEESPLYGQSVRVEKVKGVLAWVEGQGKPFLIDELVDVPQREAVPTPAPAAPSSFELLQARYERATARVEIVESMLLDLMAAVEEGDSDKVLEITAQAKELFI